MDRNKKEVLKHLETTHGRLANRITSLEKKTKDQISYLSNSMKENIAQVLISNKSLITFSGTAIKFSLHQIKMLYHFIMLYLP